MLNIEKIVIESTSPTIFEEEEYFFLLNLKPKEINVNFIDEEIAFGDHQNFLLVSTIVIFIKESVYSGIIFDLIKHFVKEIYEQLTPKNSDNTFTDVEFYESGALKRVRFAKSSKGEIKIKNHKGKWITLKTK